MQQERLLVLPNPYTFIDGDGEPQGACPADPGHAAGKRMWVGAKLDPKRTQFQADYADRPKVRRGGRDTAWTGDPRPRPQTVKFTFAKESVDIPSTAHYLDRIREGSLIAANEETFAKVFGGRAKYVEPAQALADARSRAFDEYKAATGKDPAFTREEAPQVAEAATTADAETPAHIPTLPATAPEADGAPPADSAGPEAPEFVERTGDLQPIREATDAFANASTDTTPAEAHGGTK
jgi:hypothetical protein